eukprot:4432258-Pyramimonas_sp.AAC.1
METFLRNAHINTAARQQNNEYCGTLSQCCSWATVDLQPYCSVANTPQLAAPPALEPVTAKIAQTLRKRGGREQ